MIIRKMMLTIMKPSALYVLYRIADSHRVGVFYSFRPVSMEVAFLRPIWVLSSQFLVFLFELLSARRIHFFTRPQDTLTTHYEGRKIVRARAPRLNICTSTSTLFTRIHIYDDEGTEERKKSACMLSLDYDLL